jgi:hypothetical protein
MPPLRSVARRRYSIASSFIMSWHTISHLRHSSARRFLYSASVDASHSMPQLAQASEQQGGGRCNPRANALNCPQEE